MLGEDPDPRLVKKQAKDVDDEKLVRKNRLCCAFTELFWSGTLRGGTHVAVQDLWHHGEGVETSFS